MDKYRSLVEYFRQKGSAAIAFSAGVDSTFMLYAAHEALGDRAVAITALSAFFPGQEASEAEEFCNKYGIRHVVLKEDILKAEGVSENPKNRCYLCKKSLFTDIIKTAADEGVQYVAEGSNLDDENDYRPGAKAIKELGVLSPLKEIGFTKKEIRVLSEKLGLPTWNKPAYACLASRIPYGEELTAEKLLRVEKAEKFLRELGFVQLRVRSHGDLARIEILPEDFERFMKEELRLEIYDKLKSAGFSYVSLDLKGYRMGSLNETVISPGP